MLFSIMAIQVCMSPRSRAVPSVLVCTSSGTFVIFCLFDSSNSNGRQVIAHCGFNLYSCDYQLYWAPSYIPVSRLHGLL